MDKNKSEKLKEILNQTISQEEIESKLKKEIKISATKKAKEKKEKEEEALKEIKEEKPIEKKEEAKEDLIIPNVRNKKKESMNININILLYLAGSIAVLLFIVVIYLFTSKTDIFSQSNPIVEEKVEEKIEKKIEVINDTKQIEPKVITKEIIKEKVVTKIVDLDKQNFKTYYNSLKFNTLKCYKFKAGDVFPTKSCKENLKKFLNENKNSIKFEIIPVIAQDDNILISKLNLKNNKNLDDSFKNKIEEYIFKGLGRQRVLETTWHVKDILGEDTILTPTNYYVKSKKNNKGVIIKAYY